MIGKTLSHYEIVEKLGAGGMGVVYRARDTRLNRSVAFKVLSEEFAADPDRRRRFLQEARAAGAVNHPAIAQVYDADEADGVAFIAMEFVEGRTVRDLIADRELDVLAAVEVATQVAEGLAKAHGARIVHRDIKSENIMLTPDGHAKILDFGLAKPYGDDTPGAAADGPEATILNTLNATQQGLIVGTIGYMSPEQARGRPLDHRSDIFSLGIVLYEMVSGERPFHGDSPLDTLHAIAFEETTAVTTLRPNLPPSIHRVLTKCLRKLPEDRYGSAAELARDLKGVKQEIDSGITRGIPLLDRLREKAASLGTALPAPWVIPAILIAVIATAILVSMFSDADAGALIPLALVGLLVYRAARHRRPRVMKKFAKKAAKMEEVRMVQFQDPQVTVLVENPLAKTYLHLNAALDHANRKLFFGEHFVLVVREVPGEDEVRELLAQPGLLYVRD